MSAEYLDTLEECRQGFHLSCAIAMISKDKVSFNTLKLHYEHIDSQIVSLGGESCPLFDWVTILENKPNYKELLNEACSRLCDIKEGDNGEADKFLSKCFKIGVTSKDLSK